MSRAATALVLSAAAATEAFAPSAFLGGSSTIPSLRTRANMLEASVVPAHSTRGAALDVRMSMKGERLSRRNLGLLSLGAAAALVGGKPSGIPPIAITALAPCISASAALRQPWNPPPVGQDLLQLPVPQDLLQLPAQVSRRHLLMSLYSAQMQEQRLQALFRSSRSRTPSSQSRRRRCTARSSLPLGRTLAGESRLCC